MDKDIKEQLRQLRIKQTIGKPLYKNKRTGKKWYLISSVLIGGQYTGYINFYLLDENGKNLAVPDYKFDKFYIKENINDN